MQKMSTLKPSAPSEAAAEARVVGEAQNQRRVVAVLREQGVLAVLEEVVGFAVKGENRLLPAKILLKFSIAVLV